MDEERSSRACQHFEIELNSLVDRFRDEYELTYAEAVGILEIVKLSLVVEFTNESDDES